jgi:hypothetical protein
MAGSANVGVAIRTHAWTRSNRTRLSPGCLNSAYIPRGRGRDAGYGLDAVSDAVDAVILGEHLDWQLTKPIVVVA